MDACTYESITGLKNYQGFKSLLKNGIETQRYGCDDNTIIFNRVETYNLALFPITLPINQVAVVLNLSSSYKALSSTSFIQSAITFYDVNGYQNTAQPDQQVIGLVARQTIGTYIPSTQISCVVAIFDLY